MLRRLFFHPYRLLFSPDKELFKSLKVILGFCPGNYGVYKKAFIHKSASQKISNGAIMNNERLEFLGDAVLDAIIADLLFSKFPHKKEGFLTKIRARIVNTGNLSDIAIKMGLDKFVISNLTKNSEMKNIYGDALEALIGAVYLDKGYAETKKFINNRILDKYLDIHEIEETDTNYKSSLIEWIQKLKKEIEFETSESETISKTNPVFISYVKIDNQIKGIGTGRSKKEAEQNGAKNALIMIDQKKGNNTF